jgi:RNA-directed DNA polymerase
MGCAKRITRKGCQVDWRIFSARLRRLGYHLQYYGVSGNFGGVQRYFYIARRLLLRWLNRRSQRRSVTWKRFAAVIAPSLPRARVIHHLYPKPQWKTQTGSWMV